MKFCVQWISHACRTSLKIVSSILYLTVSFPFFVNIFKHLLLITDVNKLNNLPKNGSFWILVNDTIYIVILLCYLNPLPSYFVASYVDWTFFDFRFLTELLAFSSYAEKMKAVARVWISKTSSYIWRIHISLISFSVTDPWNNPLAGLVFLR